MPNEKCLKFCSSFKRLLLLWTQSRCTLLFEIARKSLILYSQVAERSTLYVWSWGFKAVWSPLQIAKKVMFCKWRTKCCTMVQSDWQVKGKKETKILLSNKLNKNIRNHGSLVKVNRSLALSIKICADLIRNSFLFQCQVQNNAYNKLELTGLLLDLAQ